MEELSNLPKESEQMWSELKKANSRVSALSFFYSADSH